MSGRRGGISLSPRITCSSCERSEELSVKRGERDDDAAVRLGYRDLPDIGWVCRTCVACRAQRDAEWQDRHKLAYIGDMPRANPDYYWRITSLWDAGGHNGISFFYYHTLDEILTRCPELRGQADEILKARPDLPLVTARTS